MDILPTAEENRKKKGYQIAAPVKAWKQYSYFIEMLTEPPCRSDAAALNTM